MKNLDVTIGVVGLGYVGLPLLISFAKHYKMIGFDISKRKIQNLLAGHDDTNEVGDDAVKASTATYSNDPSCLKDCDVLIVAVPTPVDDFKVPDLSPVTSATNLIAKNLKPGAIIVYESTVYPGVTEEVCKPILEKAGFVHGKDFHLGYSPERINPGDHEHRFETILKIVAADTEANTEYLAKIYGKVVTAGIYKASSIRVAEAAKVIENTQRDVNIALMNELAMLFQRMGIDTREVLEAAGTKWNFIRMTPGLVGGHCIGVDPYYLTYKAEELGMHPQIIIGGRRINDAMPKFVAEQTIKAMISSGINIHGSRVLVAGLTFKEDVPDTRNSKSFDVIRELLGYHCQISALDPYVTKEDFTRWNIASHVQGQTYDALILCSAHKQFGSFLELIPTLLHKDKPAVFADVKAVLKQGTLPQNIRHWRL